MSIAVVVETKRPGVPRISLAATSQPIGREDHMPMVLAISGSRSPTQTSSQTAGDVAAFALGGGPVCEDSWPGGTCGAAKAPPGASTVI
jgi:hypothetical protein